MKVKSILAVMFVMSILTSFPLNQATTGFNPNLVNTDTSESENRGNTNPNAQLEYWVSAATYETSFTDEWSKVYATLNYDSFEDVVQCDDGGFAVVGTFDGTFGQFGKIYLLRTDSSGNHVWNETYPTGESQNRGMALVKCQDDGFAIAGNAGVNRILIRIADNGTELWRSTFTDDRGDSVKDLAYCEDGGFGILSYNGSSSWPPNRL